MSDLEIYRAQNFGNRIGVGHKAALVIVDFTVGFNDPAWFGGGNIDAAVKRTVVLLAAFRARDLPVAFSRVVYADDGSDAGMFVLKAPRLLELTEHHPAGQIVPELTPRAGELLVRKTQASAFFGTGLGPWLTQHGVDTTVIVGCTTSGCVRATVVDALSYNYRPIVPCDCVGDRALAPHQASLFDLGQKYADISTCDEVIAAVGTRRAVGA